MATKRAFEARRRVLVVDDEFVNRELLSMIISDDYDVLAAENGREALELVREHRETLSLVLLDLMMPEVDGFEVMAVMREDPELRRIPIIVLTAEKSAEVKSLKLGAVDFITKPYDMPEVILARVNRVIELAEDRNMIQSTARDELTGLLTSAFFEEYAHQLERYHPDWSMETAAMNVEHFHLINELYGRDFGDRVLRTVANRLMDFVTEADGIACRAEGDQFYIYCKAQESYERLLDQLQQELAALGESVSIRLRIGVCPQLEIDDEKLNFDQQLDRSKTACNQLRGDYANSVLYYDAELHKREVFNEQLVNDIHKALEEEQFKVYLQPKYNITGDTPVLSSAEALVRWIHPKLGFISPGVFIPLFENNGLIQLVDHYVWRKSASYIARWKKEFGLNFHLSINISRIDMLDPDFEKKMLGLLEEYGLDASDLYLEVTESAYSEDADGMIALVQRLRDHGFRIEMDDFGSGYSSLNMLFTLPVDVLKLDMKFIQSVGEDGRGMRLIQLIVDIADFLKVPIVAEGVETEKQYLLLKEAGVQVIQGYYFAKPDTVEAIEQRFREENLIC